uniref:UvrABC system protein C n=1 Tax=Nitratidesulfovibrio vulgaris (strain DSM 19637 / Miyazaki F) TaxID=883 RepID=B8DRE6_NITV9
MQKPVMSNIPDTPGVYLYKDAAGRILYVGKAKHLRKRIASYFREAAEGAPPPQTPKTLAMLRQAERLDTLSTTTEKEALLLEASLIKKHRPRYNIVLRDDKQYVLFRLQKKHPYPRLDIVRAVRRDGAQYYGPFTSAGAARATWKAIHRAFPLRRCTDRALENRVRPCLYHFIGQCLAPCVFDVPREEYAALVQRVEMLLSGRSGELVGQLRTEMETASEALEFERAAALRDQIRAVERTVERQAAVLPGGGDLDVVGIVDTGGGLGLGVLFVRQGAVLDGRAFLWPGLGFEEAPELLLSFLGQFYGPHSAIPSRIVVPWLPVTEGTEGNEGVEGDDAAGTTPPPTAPKEPGRLTASSAPEESTEPVSPVAPDMPVMPVMPVRPQRLAGPGSASSAAAQEVSAPSSAPIPPQAATDMSLRAIEETLADLRGGPVRIVAPRSPEENRLVDMAAANAREHARRETEAPLPDLLARALHLSAPVRRVEAVDISHTGGRSTRAGMVVFEDGRPVRDAWRAYALDRPADGSADLPDTNAPNGLSDGPPDGVFADLPEGEMAGHAGEVSETSAEHTSQPPTFTAGDDYAALAGWARRRIASGPPWADLVLIDGGRGQLSAVHRAVREAGGEGLFALASIAKARTEDGRADRRAGNVADRIFLPGRTNPLPLRDGAPELLFLQHVRDAVHDFAIGRHRRARAGAALTGELQRVEGVGPKTARLLWDRFGTLAAMRAASEKELAEVPGIGPRRARQIHQRLKEMDTSRRR